jgi:hypothetical protein
MRNADGDTSSQCPERETYGSCTDNMKFKACHDMIMSESVFRPISVLEKLDRFKQRMKMPLFEMEHYLKNISSKGHYQISYLSEYPTWTDMFNISVYNLLEDLRTSLFKNKVLTRKDFPAGEYAGLSRKYNMVFSPEDLMTYKYVSFAVEYDLREDEGGGKFTITYIIPVSGEGYLWKFKHNEEYQI